MLLATIVAAVSLGIAAQVIAERIRLPAILPLLVLGIVAGPGFLRWFDPNSLGHGLEVVIHLGVAIILFEGGLTLDLKRLFRVGGVVGNLLTIGVAVTGLGAAVLAHALIGLPWPTAALFGAIMTVTGPTVVMPLLRHLIAPNRVKTVLVSEGLIIDPIGAVLAYLVLQWIGHAGTGVPMRQMLGELIDLTLIGAVFGFVTGTVARLVLRSRMVSGELRNLSVLSLLMVCYLVSESRAPQSGILAAMVMGLTLAGSELPDLVSLKRFKGQLTTLVISSMFILLSGQLDLEAVRRLGLRGALTVAGLILLVRPLAVLLSAWPGRLDRKERIVLALTAPRGIVAAALASLAARQLQSAGIEGGALLEATVYLAILVTVTWSTLMAIVLPRVLGFVDDPRRKRIVLVGANAFTEVLAHSLRRVEGSIVIVDLVSWRLECFRKQGFVAVRGDARDAATYEAAGVERDTVLLAATTNDELNLLVAELVRHEFGIEHPVVTQKHPPEELGKRSRAWVDLLAGRPIELDRWILRLETGKARLIDIDPRADGAIPLIHELEKDFEGDFALLIAWTNGKPSFRVDHRQLENIELVTALVADGAAAERIRPLVINGISGDIRCGEPRPPQEQSVSGGGN
jgi:NhaP-type Na+/H+ or K+/H+ antiporter